jgi:hypothetical protein
MTIMVSTWVLRLRARTFFRNIVFCGYNSNLLVRNISALSVRTTFPLQWRALVSKHSIIRCRAINSINLSQGDNQFGTHDYTNFWKVRKYRWKREKPRRYYILRAIFTNLKITLKRPCRCDLALKNEVEWQLWIWYSPNPHFNYEVTPNKIIIKVAL